MKLALITGVSKGLGESIAKLFLESGIHVLGISRSINKQLEKIAANNHVKYHHYTCDLGNMGEIEEAIEKVKADIQQYDPSLLYLINNAAVIEPINQVSKLDNQALAYHVHLNTVVPMILTKELLDFSSKINTSFICVNITSGAAERPIYGWAAYCSSKASINMYTRTAALEQETLKTGHKIIAFNPGIMDTDMQQTIRSSAKEAFNEVEKFKAYKEGNQLRDSDTVGGILIDILNDEASIENGKIYQVNEYV
ncbi:(S)-benzoin forming benzil reductase [Ornithinibacillus sp. BX22]|uniref:(S)-benzoin forming benzil reductase n=2 Tax=Ornithinibacillus TaxID=484508 RepID=A0A923L502_9BACI|nr:MULTISPECIES: (S)-benzoin forming benzil reductase [Ornithinibacillus]MBC5636582.1 (S)-benzoin forming benzil reductase [Ornithinibacillus hominis]MBS3680576.1 (S)-benzoin forming benzil reductase [Ornithinibacillus massiliensis]